eukprot:4435566-Amphidinium_carterae.1
MDERSSHNSIYTYIHIHTHTRTHTHTPFHDTRAPTDPCSIRSAEDHTWCLYIEDVRFQMISTVAVITEQTAFKLLEYGWTKGVENEIVWFLTVSGLTPDQTTSPCGHTPAGCFSFCTTLASNLHCPSLRPTGIAAQKLE